MSLLFALTLSVVFIKDLTPIAFLRAIHLPLPRSPSLLLITPPMSPLTQTCLSMKTGRCTTAHSLQHTLGSNTNRYCQ